MRTSIYFIIIQYLYCSFRKEVLNGGWTAVNHHFINQPHLTKPMADQPTNRSIWVHLPPLINVLSEKNTLNLAASHSPRMINYILTILLRLI